MPRESSSSSSREASGERERDRSSQRDRDRERDHHHRRPSSSTTSTKPSLPFTRHDSSSSGNKASSSKPDASASPARSSREPEKSPKPERDNNSRSRLRPPPTVPSKSTKPSSSSQGLSSNEDLASDGAEDEDTGPKMNKEDLYDFVCNFEEDDAKDMDEELGLEAFLDCCAELDDLMTEMYELRKNVHTKEEILALNDSNEYMEIAEDCVVVMTDIRRYSRYLKLKLKAVRDDLIVQRQSADTDHLELQNLLYEAIHLNKQVTAVKDYKSIDGKIDLIPVEDFFKEAPASLSQRTEVQENPHMLRIARLEYEYMQRKQLTDQCEDLEKVKDGVTEQISAQQSKLENVGPLLNKILEATLPAREFFDPDLPARTRMYIGSEYLPTPLYNLYVSSVGYQEFLENQHLKVNLHGDIDAAKELFNKPQAKVEQESDSDMDVDEVGDIDIEEEDRRKLRKRISTYEGKDEEKKKLVEIHPLSIQWVVTAEGDETITVQFQYMMKLKIITIKSWLDIGVVPEKTRELLNKKAENVLANLYENDTGLYSPNPSAYFHLQKAGLDSFSDLVNDIGRPYKWAQKLCGLKFPELIADSENNDIGDDLKLAVQYESPVEVIIKSKLSQCNATIEDTFKLIKTRLKSQASLWSQLKHLETRSIQIPPELKMNFPAKNTTIFTSWENIDWTTYKSFSSTTRLINRDTRSIIDSSLFFKAVFERNRARVIALIALHLDYPKVPPMFAVEFEEIDGEMDPSDESMFREVEKELNVHAVQEFQDSSEIILSLQLQRLCYCIDICLETRSEDQSVGPSEFRREKLFAKPTKGRNFRRPFKFVAEEGGHFTQRF